MRASRRRRSISLRWHMLLLCAWIGGVATAMRAGEPTLPIGKCVVSAPRTAEDALVTQEFAFDCQLAAFGEYLRQEGDSGEAKRVLLAPGGGMLACSPLFTSQDADAAASMFNGAVVVVRRGQCSFQDKFANVAAVGGSAMALVNSENRLLPLGSLEYEHLGALAVSIRQTDGEQLIKSVLDAEKLSKQGSEVNPAVVVRMIASESMINQAQARIGFLASTNAPLSVYEEFIDAVDQLEPPVGPLDQLLGVIASTDGKQKSFWISDRSLDSTTVREWLAFFSSSAVWLSKWEFASEATLFASVSAAVLRLETFGDEAISSDEGIRLVQFAVQSAVSKLAAAGYYSQGEGLLVRLLQKDNGRASSWAHCQLGFMRFLQGDLQSSLDAVTACKSSGPENDIGGLGVAWESFLRLANMDISEHDRICLQQAVLEEAPLSTSPVTPCCYFQGYQDTRVSTVNQRRFSSAFTMELFRSLIIMGVFLDELGAFEESIRFFQHAARLCDCDKITLELRQLLAVPVVFESQDSMRLFFSEMERKLQKALVSVHESHTNDELEISPLGDAVRVASSDTTKTLLPEDASYLRYTITPPTMMIGYQGINVRSIQQAVYKLRAAAFPSLTSAFSPPEPVGSEGDSNLQDGRRRIGFISTWFRSHSVGKLLLGVIRRLDRTKFHVVIYRCVHFLRDADDTTQAFKRAADEYVELPVEQMKAVQVLRHAQLEVVVYPELGMDEWTVLLSHHRVAPVQCVFWGHPITTGNPGIDYFISSEHFISKDFHEQHADDESQADSENRLDVATYGQALFSEKIVLFRGLSTLFTEPKPLSTKVRAMTRMRLNLPANRRLYVCPQTLMKLQPAFDEALAGILERDQDATIVLLASKTQAVWTEKLRRRFRSRFGQNHRRVLFLPTLPFAEFQALLTFADVVLDPFPFGGGVTTLEALHLGTPVVTLPSAQSVVHLAAGFLRYLNASDCIAHSLDEYVTLALDIAQQPERIRDRLMAHRSAIYDDTSTIEDWNTFLATVATRNTKTEVMPEMPHLHRTVDGEDILDKAFTSKPRPSGVQGVTGATES